MTYGTRLRIRLCLSLVFLAGAFPLVSTTFTVTNTTDSGAGSLRQAILDANGNAGLYTITFNIPGSSVHTIQPLSTMTIAEAVLLDGFTQSGSSPNTLLVGNDAVYKVEKASPEAAAVATSAQRTPCGGTRWRRFS